VSKGASWSVSKKKETKLENENRVETRCRKIHRKSGRCDFNAVAEKIRSYIPHDNAYGIYMYARFIFNTEILIYIKFNFIWLNDKCINIFWKIHIFMRSHKLSLNYRFSTYRYQKILKLRRIKIRLE